MESPLSAPGPRRRVLARGGQGLRPPREGEGPGAAPQTRSVRGSRGRERARDGGLGARHSPRLQGSGGRRAPFGGGRARGPVISRGGSAGRTSAQGWRAGWTPRAACGRGARGAWRARFVGADKAGRRRSATIGAAQRVVVAGERREGSGATAGTRGEAGPPSPRASGGWGDARPGGSSSLLWANEQLPAATGLARAGLREEECVGGLTLGEGLRDSGLGWGLGFGGTGEGPVLPPAPRQACTRKG